MEKTVRVTKTQKYEIAKIALDKLNELMEEPFMAAINSENPDVEPAYITCDDLKKFFDSEIKALSKRHSTTNGKPTANQLKNQEYKKEILNFLGTLPDVPEDDPDYKAGYTATEILNGTSLHEQFQLSKVVSLLTQMGKGTSRTPGTGEVMRIVGKKGAAMFRLV